MARCRSERENERRYKEVERLFRDGGMPVLLRRYLISCGSDSIPVYSDPLEYTEDEREKKGGRGSDVRKRLPNPAGFCRFLDLERGAFDRLSQQFPGEMGKIVAVFEDEALNSQLSASVLGLYLKELLCGKSEAEEREGGISVTFEHDILEDGR